MSTCDACVSDYDSLCNQYTGVSWVGLSMTLFAIGLTQHIAAKIRALRTDASGVSYINNVLFGVLFFGLVKIAIGIVLLSALRPDCQYVDSCEATDVCKQACSAVGDPFAYYGYICLLLGGIWVVRYLQMRQLMAKLNANGAERAPLAPKA